MEACNSSPVYEDDLLIKELLHYESPIILSDSFISNTYSGPTITDIETALLASSNYTNNTHDFLCSLDRISEMERGASKVENKYILKIKSSGNVMADDGYKWRKYGQKTIKNSSNPRSYYKCTNTRCGAKKQVERSNDDPDTLIITYEGLHLHYMYPFFIFGDQSDLPTNKFRRFNFDTPAHVHDQQTTTKETKQDQPSTDYQPQVATTAISSQGLLEDMVPLLIRNPVIYTSKSSSSSSSSHPFPPTSPSFSWSPDFDAYLS